MLHVRWKSMSRVAAVSLLALLQGCAVNGTDLPAADLAAAEQALTTDLPLLSPAAAAGMIGPEPSALRHHQPGDDPDDLFDLARGRWVGNCDILLPGQDEPVDSVEMERITEPTGNPNEYTWTIIYRGPDFEQVRPYTIQANPDTPGRYIVDEHNGILLTHALLDGNILVSEFQVQNVRLVTREVFHGNKYDFEITVMSTTPELSSDLGDGFVVDSFRVLNMQKCKLRRRGGHH